MENLDTSDLLAAQKLRDAFERETLAVFDAIRAGTWAGPKTLDAREQGQLYRAAIFTAEEIDTGDEESAENGHLAVALWSAEATGEAYRSDDERAAFVAGLQGREPVGEHLEAYLRASDFAPKTVAERRGNIGRFAKWAAAQRPALTLDLMTGKGPGAMWRTSSTRCILRRKRSTSPPFAVTGLGLHHGDTSHCPLRS